RRSKRRRTGMRGARRSRRSCVRRSRCSARRRPRGWRGSKRRRGRGRGGGARSAIVAGGKWRGAPARKRACRGVADEGRGGARAARDALKEELWRFGDQTARREAAARDLARQRDEARARLSALPSIDALDEARTLARKRWLDAEELAKALAEDVTRAGGADAD